MTSNHHRKLFRAIDKLRDEIDVAAARRDQVSLRALWEKFDLLIRELDELPRMEGSANFDKEK